MRLRIALLLAALLALPAAAQAAPVEPPGVVKSANVSWVTTLDEPQVISARFRGGLMYVSTLRGPAIYDVRNPAAPVKLGELPLPHFENEDVDVGGNIMLVSNDPSEGKGMLYVVDISDPASPEVVGTLETGYVDVAQDIILGFAFGLLGRSWEQTAGTGHTASCIDDCRFAYLAGTAHGIDVVDLRDPTRPKIVKNLPVAEVSGGVATHDVQVDEQGLAWIAGYGGTAAYDVSDPLNPVKVLQTGPEGRSRYIDEPVNDGSTLNDFIHHNSLRRDDVVYITEEDYTRPGCEGGGSFQAWEIPEGQTTLRPLDSWSVEHDRTKGVVFCSAHYFDERDGLVAQGFYEQGTRFLDVSDPRDIRQVGYWIPRFNETWGALYPPTDATGNIVYALDTARGIDVLRIDRSKRDTVVAPPTIRTQADQLRAIGATAAYAGLCRLLRTRSGL